VVSAEDETVNSPQSDVERSDGVVETGATRMLAAFVSELRQHHVPPDVINKAKACVLDTLGCMLFGSTLPWTRIVAEQACEQGGAPQALIIGTGERTSVTQAALVNATAGHAFELDDAHTRASMHAGSIAVATALAISEWRADVSGGRFLTSVVAGYEAGLRVGIAGAGNIFKRGFHSAAVCGVFVSAATAASLLRLDPAQTQHAFGVAGSLSAGLMAAQEGAMVKRLHAGHAARTGVYAALLARRGFTGIQNVLEAPFGGFFHALSTQHDRDALTSGLGTAWETMAVGFKPYATAGACHAALSLLDEIMSAERLSAHDIERVEVRCTSYCKAHVGWPYVAQGVASAQINLYYALAVMALDRAAMIEQFREGRLDDAATREFMSRIAIFSDPELDALGNAYRYATRLSVLTTGGARHERETRYRPGSAEAPLGQDAIERKFRLLASYALNDGAVALQAEIARLDLAESVCGLVGMLEPCRSSGVEAQKETIPS
jgi:2-methylcitrate dehydratase PrpD